MKWVARVIVLLLCLPAGLVLAAIAVPYLLGLMLFGWLMDRARW